MSRAVPNRHSLRWTLAAAAGLTAGLAAAPLTAPLGAQLTDGQLRIAPTAMSWGIAADSGRVTVSQVGIPIFVAVPLGEKFAVDVGTSFATSSFSRRGVSRSLSGLTDVQLRGVWAITDALVLTVGVNAPTGQATVARENLELAGMIGTDVLTMPVPAYGIGPAFTGGLVYGADAAGWSLSGGMSVRQATGFRPFTDTTTRFVPGSEYRLAFNADRGYGSGRLALGLSGSAFGGQTYGTAATSTGSRLVAQAAWAGALGDGKPQLLLSAWHLFAAAGEFNSLPIPSQNLSNVQVAIGFGAGAATIEPTVEARLWNAGTGRTATLAILGLRTRIPVGDYTVSPGAAFGLGTFGHSLGVSVPFEGNATGYRLTLGMGRSF